MGRIYPEGIGKNFPEKTQEVFEAEFVKAAKANFDVGISFTVADHDTARTIIKHYAKLVERQWQENEADEGENWYSLVNYNSDNFGVDVFVYEH